MPIDIGLYFTTVLYNFSVNSKKTRVHNTFEHEFVFRW